MGYIGGNDTMPSNQTYSRPSRRAQIEEPVLTEDFPHPMSKATQSILSNHTNNLLHLRMMWRIEENQ